MNIQTTRQNNYSYLQRTNEIVCGVVNERDYAWTFEPLKHFETMPNVDMFIISITEQCNLRCSYCCYSGAYPNNRTHTNLSMTEEDIDKVITFIKGITTARPVRIAFYGGEPLTCFSLIQTAVKKALSELGEETTFSISTNGTLLSKEKIDWLADHEVELLLSIDGTAPFHDKNRKDIHGNGTFKRIHDALEYIEKVHPDYTLLLYIIMTLPSVSTLEQIAVEWNNDKILSRIAPTMISGLAPNFSQSVEMNDWEKIKILHLHLLNIYEQHPEYLVLKTYFNQCISYWKNRPIVEANGTIPMATCLPLNTKLYIDTKLTIGVCEKTSDKYRIGTVTKGIDWNKANEMVEQYYTKRVNRCTDCPAIRMCDLCLTAVEYDKTQWDILCHNERISMRLNFLLFCEMAERGMVKIKEFPAFHSKQCELTEVTDEDIPMLHEIMNDADTKHYLPDLYKTTHSRIGMERFIESFKAYFEDDEGILWGIRKHDTLIGFVATMDLSTNPTIYFAMHPKYRNQGYMQESVRLATQYICDAKLTNELHTEVNVDNIASRKVLEHCGYNVSIVNDRETLIFKRIWDI